MSSMKDDVSRIVKAIGGAENVQSATHCVTRLRLILKDQNKVDVKSLDNIDLVKGNFLAGGQFQIVIGPNVGKVYEEFVEQTDAKEVSKNDMKQEIVSKQNPLQRLVRLLGDIFIPIIPAIVASGLLMGLNNVMGNPGIFYEDASFIEMHPVWQGFYDVVNLIAQTSFSFLPALVGWSAVKKFGGNPLLGIVLGLILVNPSLTSAYDYAADPAACPTWNIFGLHVAQCGYQGQVLPVLVASWLLVKLQKFFEKHIPDAVQLIFVAPLSLLITGFASFIVIGPITMEGANLITDGIVGLFNVAPVLGGAVYGLICPPLVITGMHHLFLGVNLQMAGSLGYVTLWPVGEPVTIAQGAACLAVAYLVRKNRKQSNVALTSGLSSFMGITEPAIYGVNLRNRYPFVAVMIAGAIGGAWMGFWGVKSTSVGVGGVLSFLSVFPEQWGLYLSGEVMTFVITIVMTIVLSRTKLNVELETVKANGIINKEEAEIQKESLEKEETKKKLDYLSAFVSGKVIPIEEVKDTVFSQKTLGDGLAIEPTDQTLVAPADGEVSLVMEGSCHACGLTLENGMEILLHIGLDTVDMEGDGFQPFVKAGDKVKKGDRLIKFDLKKIEKAGHPATTVMVITGNENDEEIRFHTGFEAQAGKDVIAYLGDNK